MRRYTQKSMRVKSFSYNILFRFTRNDTTTFQNV